MLYMLLTVLDPLAVGLTSIIAVQSVINMGVVTGSLPVTGITCPC